MPSNEDYLDNLLKSIENQSENNEDNNIIDQQIEADESQPEEPIMEENGLEDIDMGDMDALLAAASIDLNTAVSLSEEEFDTLLLDKQNQEPSQDDLNEVDDLNELLNGLGDDENIQEISDLLEMSDSNELIDSSMISLMQDSSDDIDFNMVLDEQYDDEPIKEESALKRGQVRREAKKEARKAKIEAKKAAKIAKIESKKVAKAETKNKKESNSNIEESLSDNVLEQQTMEVTDNEDEFDLSDLNELTDLFGNLDEETSDGLIDDLNSDKEDVIDEILGKEKRGFFSRVFAYLTEEDEDIKETGSLKISDENKDILMEMDRENKKGKKKKKEKQTKESKKEKKPKKASKPKKEKIIVEDNQPKLKPKKIIPIFILSLGITILIVLVNNIVVDNSDRKTASVAFYEYDYQTCYQNLYGKELNESEQVMFGKSEAILRMNYQLTRYQQLVAQDLPLEALDSLMQTLYDYPKLYEFAEQWNSTAEVQVVYDQILNVLLDKYHLSEEQAFEIIAEPSDLEYTKMILSITEGNIYEELKNEIITNSLEDVLPEEEELEDTSFIGSEENL